MRRPLPFLIPLVLTALLAPALPQNSEYNVRKASAVDAAFLHSCKNTMTSVLGRVMEIRETGGMTCLILDGGALYISMFPDASLNLQGKLIESTGVIEETPPAKPGASGLPPLRMIQMSKKGIRLIDETPESGRSVLIQRISPGQATRSSLEPPGLRPDAASLARIRVPYSEKQLWTRKNGQKATVAFSGWTYRRRTAADLKTIEWAVEMSVFNTGNPGVSRYLPEDLDLSPAEEERLRLSLWKDLMDRERSPRFQPEAAATNPKTDAVPAVAREQEEARKLQRHGNRVPFPGLPPEGFTELGVVNPDRALMAPLPSEKAEFSNESEAICQTAVFTWWDKAGILALPAKDGFKRSQEALLNYFKRNKVWRGMLDEYGEKYLNGQYAFQITADWDCSPENLSRYTTGSHGVVLHLQMWDDRKRQFVQQVALLSATPQGAVTFCAWGGKVEGVLTKVDLHGKSKRPQYALKAPDQAYELTITGPPDVQKMVEKRGYRLVLENRWGSSIMAITPYIRKPSAAPPAGAGKP